MGKSALVLAMLLLGCDGSEGPPGPAGATGPAGAMGAMGTPGSNGMAGTAATPIVRWADANGTVLPLLGTAFDFRLQYFDQQGLLWLVDRTTLAVSPAEVFGGIHVTTCGADPVLVGCAHATDVVGDSNGGAFPAPPRVTFLVQVTNEIRVRNDDAPAVMTDSCSDNCPVLVSNTRIVTPPVFTATGPLHPVLAP